MNIILITSVINISNNKLSYSNIRSIFSEEERFNQTKKTISSVKDNFKDTSQDERNFKIFLIESSNINKEYEKYLIDNVDYYINLNNDFHLMEKINGISKALGEGTQTMYALDYLLNNNIAFTNLFKISGRYYLSEKFDYLQFQNNNIVVKKINESNIFTAFYKMPYNEINSFLTFLKNNISDMNKCEAFEFIVSKFINTKKNTKYIKNTGLRGYVSHDGSLYDE